VDASKDLSIRLQPIGPVESSVLEYLKLRLSSIWAVTVSVPVHLPSFAFDPSRRQYDAEKLLQAIPPYDAPVLGIIDEDAFIENFNFIFGLAAGNKAMISLWRLRPQFYGLARDDELFNFRALKEAMHELGHVFGLPHCPDRRCVMHFSSTIEDTDFKDWRYCRWCEGVPPGPLRGPSADGPISSDEP
jgi:archaemetzincin